MLKLVCGTCGQSIRIRDHAIGHRARCRGCGMEFVVPDAMTDRPEVVMPAGEPEFGISRPTPPAADRMDPFFIDGEEVRDVSPPLASSPEVPRQLDEEFLGSLEANRHRHIPTGQPASHTPRSTNRRRRNRTTLAIFGGVTAIIAVVVVCWFIFVAINGGPQPPRSRSRDQSQSPTHLPQTIPQPDPRVPPPALPVQPVESPESEVKLRVNGLPTLRNSSDISNAFIQGSVINEHAGLVEKARVTVMIHTDDGRLIGQAFGTAESIPPGGRAPFTINVGNTNNSRIRTPQVGDYTVTGQPDGCNDWVELSVTSIPRVDGSANQASGGIKNNTTFRVGHIRVTCDLYCDHGPLILHKKATLRDPNVQLRPGSCDTFTLKWTNTEVNDELLANYMTCRAFGRRLVGGS